MNDVPTDSTYSREIHQKKKIFDKRIFKNIWIKQFQWNTVAWPYLGTAIVCWWALRRAASKKES